MLAARKHADAQRMKLTTRLAGASVGTRAAVGSLAEEQMVGGPR